MALTPSSVLLHSGFLKATHLFSYVLLSFRTLVDRLAHPIGCCHALLNYPILMNNSDGLFLEWWDMGRVTKAFVKVW